MNGRRPAEAIIVRHAGVMGGSPLIAGTRVRVSDVVRHSRLWTAAPVRHVCEAIPHLTARQVTAALRYYKRHPDEIEREIHAEEALAAECRTRQLST